MVYIVYETICTANNKIYIGVHGTQDPEIFDGYIGCGVYVNRPATYKHPNTPFKFAVKKYGIKSFIRTTLKIFNDELEAYKLEAKLVTADFINRDDTYNFALGGRDTHLANGNKHVYMYDLDGTFEMEFESLRKAALFLDPKSKGPGHLPRAIKQGHQYLGHQFSYEKVPCMKKLKHRKMNGYTMPNQGAKVGQYTVEGELVKVYDNMTQCVKAGFKNAKQVALGKRNFCKGFIFKYLD